MRKILLLILILIMGTANAETGTVKLDDPNGWLNIRETPSEYAKVVGKLDAGVEIEYEQAENSSAYLAVKSGKTTIGYVASIYIEKTSIVEKMLAYKKYIVLTDVSMTDDCIGEVSIVGPLNKGTLVEGIVEHINFVHVVGGGFVPKSALKEVGDE